VVTVYYDPTQPEIAVLDPTNKSGVAAPLLTGIFLIAVGSLFLFHPCPDVVIRYASMARAGLQCAHGRSFALDL